jgi:putative ABC transport system ATP-binding protein
VTARQTAPAPTATLAPFVIELQGAAVGPREPGSRRRAQHRRGAQPAALDPVDLSVRAGELVMLTGQARSGRSTLLSVIGLLLRPTAGRYLLNGLDTARLRDRDRTSLRGREIGFVFQPTHLLPARSALENVMLPLLYSGLPGQARRSIALDSLELVGLAAQGRVLAAELSAGERQRVAIARALVTSPSLLLCDDPTSGLDPGQAARVIGLLTGLHSAGRTVLIATADQLAAAYSSRCVTIGDTQRSTPR